MKTEERSIKPHYLLKAAALVLFLSSMSAAQIAVIANKSVPISSIDKRLALEIYSLSTQEWEDGSHVTVITLVGNEKVGQKFHEFIGRTALQMRKIWMRAHLSGESHVPVAMSSEEAVAQKVASTPGAIGYVGSDHVPKNVKILGIIE
jgi:ABC-type phosphate transport system substrate-binding protein